MRRSSEWRCEDGGIYSGVDELDQVDRLAILFIVSSFRTFRQLCLVRRASLRTRANEVTTQQIHRRMRMSPNKFTVHPAGNHDEIK